MVRKCETVPKPPKKTILRSLGGPWGQAWEERPRDSLEFSFWVFLGQFHTFSLLTLGVSGFLGQFHTFTTLALSEPTNLGQFYTLETLVVKV